MSTSTSPSTTPSPSARPLPRQLLSRLQVEWDRLNRTPAALRTARSWGLAIERFDSLDELLRHAGYGRVIAGGHDDDDVLGQLVMLAHRDDLAARVVLQRLLPGVAVLARRRARGAGGLDSTDDVLAAAWTVIRTFPAGQRPHYVAANMFRSIKYLAFQQGTRRMNTSVVQPMHMFEQRAAAEAEQAAADELAELLALAEQSGLQPADMDLARRLGRGETTAQLARERQVTDRTIRNHRAVVAHRLRAVALACA